MDPSYIHSSNYPPDPAEIGANVLSSGSHVVTFLTALRHLGSHLAESFLMSNHMLFLGISPGYLISY
jgi:hypothetical protein